MKKFFHQHPDIVIGSVALVLFVILAGCYWWAINNIYTQVHQALTSSVAAGSDSFNLDGAGQLDLRGTSDDQVIQPSAPSSTATSSAADAGASSTAASAGK